MSPFNYADATQRSRQSVRYALCKQPKPSGGFATDDVHVCIMCLRAIMNHQVLSLVHFVKPASASAKGSSLDNCFKWFHFAVRFQPGVWPWTSHQLHRSQSHPQELQANNFFFFWFIEHKCLKPNNNKITKFDNFNAYDVQCRRKVLLRRNLLGGF